MLFHRTASVDINILEHWKWPAPGTGSVPVVSAHCRSPWYRDVKLTSVILRVVTMYQRVVVRQSVGGACEVTGGTAQSCPWVGLTYGLGWVGLGRDFSVFGGLERSKIDVGDKKLKHEKTLKTRKV